MLGKQNTKPEERAENHVCLQSNNIRQANKKNAEGGHKYFLEKNVFSNINNSTEGASTKMTRGFLKDRLSFDLHMQKLPEVNNAYYQQRK